MYFILEAINYYYYNRFWFSYQIYLVDVQQGTFQVAVALMQERTQGTMQ